MRRQEKIQLQSLLRINEGRLGVVDVVIHEVVCFTLSNHHLCYTLHHSALLLILLLI